MVRVHAFSSPRGSLHRTVGEMAAVLLASLVVGGLFLLPSGTTPALGSLSTAPADDSWNLTLALTPGSWTMPASTSAGFAVAVVGASDGCSVLGFTPGWSLPGPSANAGFLNRSAGTTATFTAFASPTGGAAELEVEGPVDLGCGTAVETVWAVGFAALTILPSPTLAGPFVTPDPALPGTPVSVGWQMAGGLPPYSVTVAFGDGTQVNLTETSAGTAQVVHRFLPGSFEPAVRVADSQGHQLNASASAPVEVAYGLTAAIVTPGPVVDVGRPFELSVNISGGTAPYDVEWMDGTAPVAGPTWDVAVPAAGTFNATVEVTDFRGQTVQVSDYLTVVDAPSVSVGVPSAAGDAGVAFPVRFNLTGGVGPYRIDWTTSPGGNATNSTFRADGSYLEPATAPGTGPAWLTVGVSDVWGDNQTIQVPLPAVRPDPRVEASVTPAVAETGELIRLTLTVVGGSGPFRWNLIPSGPVDLATTGSGVLGADGSVAWSGAPAGAGNLSFDAEVTDANGVDETTNVSLRVVPGLDPMLAVATASPVQGSAMPMSGLLAGGVPPYVFGWSASDGENGVGNRSTPGPVDFAAAPRLPGYLTVRFWVVDSLGDQANATVTSLVSVSTPSPGPPSSSTSGSGGLPSWGWVPVGVVVLAVGYWAVRSRRSPTPTPPPASAGAAAMGAVRRLLQESGELERETLTFLAEEEGYSSEATLAAVDRWSKAGKLRSETGADGEVVLRWADHGPSRSPGRAEEGL